MKKLIYGMLMMGALLTSCGDDEPACTADDYVGIYTGVVNCPGEDSVSGAATISKISDLQVSLFDSDGFVFLLDVNECEAKGTITEDGTIYSVTINLMDEGFSYVGVSTFGGDTYTCTGDFNK